MRSLFLLLVPLALTTALGQAPPVVSTPAVPSSEVGRVPDGFTPIFNGKDLAGWHVSRTNHHGTTPDYHVLHGVIVGTQQPRGKGGILLTDRKLQERRGLHGSQARLGL